jgi:phospholipid/cholesterol/gamma-HCH transport system substrate-binding protein
MKHDLSKKIKVGIFVTVGIALFVIAVYAIGKQQKIFGSYITLNSVFANVSGLQEGSNVRFSGIVVGKIDLIEIIGDSAVNITMRVEKDVQKFIKKDSKASIGSEGLMGSRVLNISHGSVTAESVETNDTLMTIHPIEPDQILQSLHATALNAEVITADMAEIFSRINKGEGAVGVLLNDPEFARTFEEAMINIEKGTENFSENMKALQNNILFRGYFRKKERERERQEKEAAAAEAEGNTEKKPENNRKNKKQK